jgi:membrane protein DedA with SNARE-associated domain
VPGKAAITLTALAALAWSGLLFGIGLDDLSDGDTRLGVIFSIALLLLVIAGLAYAIWRVGRHQLAKRLAKR